ncbi:MAG: MotA/TolQ/ExbB proton channel family protein [Candidatus Methylacidiphilales bacterium]|nr:MotA/TolQ/ExbB proton channel family protein [Candidatus Methylacidiphilales bacterium]
MQPRSRALAPALLLTVLSLPLFFSVAQAQGTTTSTPTPASPELTLWQLVSSLEWVLIPLGLLSVAVVALIVFNFFWLRRSNLVSADFLTESDTLLKNRRLEELADLCEKNNQIIPRILGKVILFAKANPSIHLESLKEIAEVEGGRAVSRLNMPTMILMDLGVMAPMVGLMGTVVGILRSFGTLASDATPMRTMVLAGGVSQALAATAIGLGIGLTAMAFYAFFRPRVQDTVGHLESTLTVLLIRTNDCLARGKSS